MAEPDGLFALDPAWLVAPAPDVEPGEQLSAGRRLTIRKTSDLLRGLHPISRGRLHVEAAPADDRKAPGLRCGGCRFWTSQMWGDVASSYPKCWFGYDEKAHYAPRASRGPGTDCRAWYPACTDFQLPDPEEQE